MDVAGCLDSLELVDDVVVEVDVGDEDDDEHYDR